MQLESVLAHLPEGAIASSSLCDPNADVYNVSFLTLDTAAVREDVLYFGDETLLPSELDPGKLFNCVLFGGDVPESLGGRPNVNVVTLTMDVDPYDCYNNLQDRLLENQAEIAIVRRMLHAHFSNKGLQFLIEEAAMAMGNPIVVVDPTYRYVAHHLGDLEGDSSRFARVISEEIQNETLVEDAIAYIRNEGIDAKIAKVGGTLIHHNKRLDANTMTSAVMVHGICMAHVMMVEHRQPFSTIDQYCFEQLADFVGQELQKSEILTPSAGELGAFFLANLLNDRAPSEAVTLRRMRALNFHPKPVLQVVCLHASGEGLGQLQVEQLAGQLRPILHHALYTRFHQQLVILFSRDNEDGIDERAERLLSEVAALNKLSCGISNVFDRMVDARAGYDQARHAVRYGDRMANVNNDHGVYRYCNYAYLHGIDLVNRRTNLFAMCHPALLRLRAHDEARGGELMDTLYCYLQVAGSTARAAQLLSLHKNTLLYRLGRIRELLGMDLTSGEDIFYLQASFRVLIFLELFKPRLKLSREDLQE